MTTVKMAACLVVGDYIVSCNKHNIQGKVIAIHTFTNETANPWSDTTQQNAANWKGAIIRARNPIGSNRKQVISTLPPSSEEARAAANDLETTYKTTNTTIQITTPFGKYSIEEDTECKVIEPETAKERFMRIYS